MSFLLKLPRTLRDGVCSPWVHMLFTWEKQAAAGSSHFLGSRQKAVALNLWILLSPQQFRAPGGELCPVVRIQRLPAVSWGGVCGPRGLRQSVTRPLVTGDLVAV